SVLDFGTRPLTVADGASLDVGDGTLTLRAASVTFAPGAALLGRGLRDGPRGGTIAIVTDGDVRIDATTSKPTRVDLSAEGLGGVLDITAGGDVSIAAPIS